MAWVEIPEKAWEPPRRLRVWPRSDPQIRCGYHRLHDVNIASPLDQCAHRLSMESVCNDPVKDKEHSNKSRCLNQEKSSCENLSELKEYVWSRQKLIGSSRIIFWFGRTTRAKTDHPSQSRGLDKRRLEHSKRCRKKVIVKEIRKKIEIIKNWIKAKDSPTTRLDPRTKMVKTSWKGPSQLRKVKEGLKEDK